MFSHFSTAKIGMLLEDLSDCQNSAKRGPFVCNFYEAYQWPHQPPNSGGAEAGAWGGGQKCYRTTPFLM